MKLKSLMKPFAISLALAGMGAAGYLTHEKWLPWFQPAKPATAQEHDHDHDTKAPENKVVLNDQVQANLKLTAKPLVALNYWKTIPVPGMVIDRPGFSDRGVVAPATGIVAKVNHVPGDTVSPGAVLFTLKLLSETVHLTQTELFKATQDISLAQVQMKRLKDSGGAIPEARVIEVESQITRLEVAVKAYRQELQNRGFNAEMLDGIASGKFVNELNIVVPARTIPADETVPANNTFEVQELKVELGQQVQAGQTLCLLANHQRLAVEGRAFRDETPLLERSVKEHWPVYIDFMEETASDWGEAKQTFSIRYLANTIDPLTRTFAFLVPLENQSRVIKEAGRTQTLWRYRPGQRVRLLVRVEELKNVFVLPADAVTRDGAEAYVFTQNVDMFMRKPVRVLLQDRQQVVIANDGSLPPGVYVAQTAAAQLNRMVKAGGNNVPKGFHMHADGSLHQHVDEGK